MKFAGVLPFVVGALAVTRRQAGNVPDALDAITDATTDAGNAVQAFNGDFTDVATKSAAVISAINAADAIVDGSDTLSSDQVVALLDPTKRLNAAVKTAIDNTIAQHDAFVAACYAQEILQGLQQQQKASAALVSDIAAKAGSLSDAVKSGAGPAAADVQRGIDAFADAKACEASSSSAAPEATSQAAEASAAPPSYGTSTRLAPVYQPVSQSQESSAPPAVSTKPAATKPIETAPAYQTPCIETSGAAMPTGTGYPTHWANSSSTSTYPPIETYKGAASRENIVSFAALVVAAAGIAAF